MLTLFEIDKTSFNYRLLTISLPDEIEKLLNDKYVEEYLDICGEILKDKTSFKKYESRLLFLMKQENVLKFSDYVTSKTGKRMLLGLLGPIGVSIFSIIGKYLNSVILSPWISVPVIISSIIFVIATMKWGKYVYRLLPDDISEKLEEKRKKLLF